ncbi:MAG: hypothetical protein J2P24_09015 [Streptosporangiales bacterium]|nr:hypothetical protein [Streptosporangiales bacterium]MBO0890438.1 hypothetical protein [Acidothermales bacterium]
MKRSAKVAIAAGASVLVVGTGVGVASAASFDDGGRTPSGSTSARPWHHGRQHRHGGAFRRMLHGQFTLAGRQHRVVDVQSGEVQAVTSRSVTVQSQDGYTHTYAVDGDSRVRMGRQPSSIGQVAKGDQVWVVAEHAGSTVLRLGVRDR